MTTDTLSVEVLIVDDEPAVVDALDRALVQEGYAVASAGDGRAALERVARARPDAVILDVSMPQMSGLEVCRRMRANGDRTPVLMLTARNQVTDRVAGLDAGADDYLVKPFAPEELLARLRALLRRGREPDEVVGFADVVLDVRARTARRGARELHLSAREAALLELLVRNPRQVVSREMALERIWGSTHAASPNVVDRYVSYLRRKLGEPPLIETVRGVGFVLGR